MFASSALLVAVSSGAVAAPPATDVVFSIAYDAPPGQSVFVVGDRPELGGGDVRFGVKLVPSDSSADRVTVSMPRGVEYSYRFVVRDDAAGRWGDLSNGTAITGEMTGVTPPGVTAPERPVVFAYTTFDRPTLRYRTVGGAFASRPMRHIGAGRVAGERLVAATRVGDSRDEMEFFIENDAGPGRVPSAGTLALFTDRVIVQDGEVFAYLPDAEVSEQRKDYDPSNPATLFSTHLGEARRYRVLLPRGYDTHTDKRYPVLYMHDGQNVFDQGAFGTWNVDETASRLERFGISREVIIVGMDHGVNRSDDYLSSLDGFNGDGYTAFVRDELIPIIDTTYRTLTGPEHTGTAGSSFGGVAALHQSYLLPGTFGRAGVFSPSVWAMPNLLQHMIDSPNPDLRVYLDSGDAGASNDGFGNTVFLRDVLLSKAGNPFAIEGELRHVVGFGQVHNEPAWAARFPGALEFLFPVDEEPDRGLDALPAEPACPADLAPPFDAVSLGDIAAFVTAFEVRDPLADLGEPFGQLTFADIGAFVRAYTAGCP